METRAGRPLEFTAEGHADGRFSALSPISLTDLLLCLGRNRAAGAAVLLSAADRGSAQGLHRRALVGAASASAADRRLGPRSTGLCRRGAVPHPRLRQPRAAGRGHRLPAGGDRGRRRYRPAAAATGDAQDRRFHFCFRQCGRSWPPRLCARQWRLDRPDPLHGRWRHRDVQRRHRGVVQTSLGGRRRPDGDAGRKGRKRGRRLGPDARGSRCPICAGVRCAASMGWAARSRTV